MTCNELILLTLGIGTADDKMDEICENFDLEIDDYTIEEAIQNNINNLNEVQNALIESLYNQVIENAVEQGLERDKFEVYANSLNSHLSYNGERINDKEDIENILKEKHEQQLIEYLEENNIQVTKGNNSWELVNYTNAGGEQIITLSELTKEELGNYLNGFDLNEETLIHCQDKNNIPLGNVKSLYEDLEEWLDDMYDIVDNMPEFE